MKLNDLKWRAFNVTDIFDHIQRGKRLKNADHIPGNQPYVSSSALNNGVADWIKPTENSRFFGESISLANSGSVGTAFYEPFDYVASDHITSFHLGNGSKYIYLFMVACLEKQKHNFSFNREVNEARLKRLRIMLPVNAMDQPDYDFMSDYVRERLSQKRQSYLDDVNDRLAELGTVQSLPAINSVDWKPFVISELFSKLVGGKGKGLVHLRQVDSGGIEYLGATNRNNGVLCRVALDDVSKPMVQSGNCIGFIKNGDGAAGYAIYKKEPFISTTDVIYGYAHWLNPYTGLFFVGSQDLIRPKYGHGYKRNARHLRVDKVMLPTMSDGTPDYKYMEQYVKNKMIQKYNNYLQYINAR